MAIATVDLEVVWVGSIVGFITCAFVGFTHGHNQPAMYVLGMLIYVLWCDADTLVVPFATILSVLSMVRIVIAALLCKLFVC